MSEEGEFENASIHDIESEFVESEAEIVTSQIQLHEEVVEEEAKDKHDLNVHNKFDDETSPSKVKRDLPVLTGRKTSHKLRSISVSDPNTKRVLAPYLKVIRRYQKGLEPEEEKENKQFEYYLKQKPSVLLRNLSQFLDNKDIMTILFQTAKVLKEVVKAVGVTPYIVDEAAGEICQYPRNVLSERHRVTWKIEEGKTVAAYVASTKDYVITDEVLGDVRFLDGAAYQDETIKSVLCVPIVNPDNVCIAIFELYRDVYQPNFCNDDLNIVVAITSWLGTAVYQNEQRSALQKQQELNDFLLDLILCYFAQTVPIEKLISEVVTCAKDTIGTKRGSFYIVYQEGDGFEADIFEEGVDGTGKLHKKYLRMKLEPNSILGVVARTLQPLNIADAFADPRYDSEADLKLGVITRSLLCVPITSVTGILGVIQLTNKTTGVCFTYSDENLLKTFSLYCAIALQYFMLNKSLLGTDKLGECFIGLINYHTQPCSHNFQYYTEQSVVELPKDFDELTWHITSDLYLNMPKFLMSMMIGIIGAEEVDTSAMMKFILSAQKAYLDNPYHNFEHAFTVCHGMYTILLRNREAFTIIELKSLLIASLCHDLDHKGLTNKFLQTTNNNLAQLYEESYLENHHYQMTLILLQDCKIFKTMNCFMFKEILFEIKDLILSTDLVAHVKLRKKFFEMLQESEFDWQNYEHRKLLKNMMIGMGDLSAQCKSYSYAEKASNMLYKEFYHEGDLSKKIGVMPLPLMDRDKAYLVPEDQVQFLTIVVIPCAELLASILPNTETFLIGAKKVRLVWLEIIELRGQKCWRPRESTTND